MDGGRIIRKVNFSRGDISSKLNKLFTNSGLKGTAEGKDYRTLSNVHPFVTGFIDCAIELGEYMSMMKLHTANPDLLCL